jgi:hypothetical protein
LDVLPELVTVAVIDKTYPALLLSLSGTVAITKLLVLVGPSSPRLMDTARGLLTTPSVVTPPPELPVRVTAPPELISTNFETVALMLTVPVVLCPKHVSAATLSKIANSNERVRKWGEFIFFEAGREMQLSGRQQRMLTAGLLKIN